MVAAALTDAGREGVWARALLTSDELVAPHLMPAEAANILRRATLAGTISADVAALALADLLQLPTVLFPYEPFAARTWELRATVTAYDAWYVALAEALEADLATLDLRLARAPGPRCAFATPST
jgi:predicted nucleic acid-binding protein